MAVQAHTRAQKLSEKDLLEMYWYMLLSRRLDERAWAIHRQGKIAFHVSAIGHEGAQIGVAFAINRGVDYVYPYYRDLTLSLSLGVTARDIFMSLYGKAGEYSSGARQMPGHYSLRERNLVSGSAVVATQVPESAGLAFSIKYKQQCGMVDPHDASQPRLALTALGEGATSQGEWHEALNWAGVHKLPMICLVENNMYAISVPMQAQMAVPNVADRASAYGIHGVCVDGNDVLAMYEAAAEATERAYNGDGATLIEAKTYRLVPHSSDDDDRSYRSREEVEAWRQKDPLPRFQTWLMQQTILTQAIIDEYDARARAEVERAQAETEALPFPAPEDALGKVYAPNEEGEAHG
jgi:2-oxoisovalerate dehydrogenase E1 component alpha subunit